MEETFYVVETEDNIFLGLIEFVDESVVVRNGFQGHPVRVDRLDIVLLCPAEMHPAVVGNYVQAI